MTRNRSTPSLASGTRRYRLPGGRHDLLVLERPLVIRVGRTTLVTLRTPGNEEELALGFLRTEGVIADAGSVAVCRYRPARRPGGTDEVRIRLRRGAALARLGALSRVHEIRASCGACGASPRSLGGAVPRLPSPGRIPPPAALRRMFRAMAARQGIFRATGACHGAALFGPNGSLWSCREDVGRHNALDKAVGAALRAGRDLTRATLLLSGRNGYELTMKALRCGIPVQASVGAPTSLSLDLARAAGAALLRLTPARRTIVYHTTV